MTVNEILLIVAIVTILVVTPLIVKRIKQPFNVYIRIISCLFLLVMAWIFADNDKLLPKLFLTGVAAFGIIKAISDYVKGAQQTNAGDA